MSKSTKKPKPEKNSIQAVKHLLELSKKDNSRLEKELDQAKKAIEHQKKDIAKLTAALEERFSGEEIKSLVVKMVKKRDASLKKSTQKKDPKPLGPICPKCNSGMAELKKADGTIAYKCLKCMKKT